MYTFQRIDVVKDLLVGMDFHGRWTAASDYTCGHLDYQDMWGFVHWPIISKLYISIDATPEPKDSKVLKL